MSERPPRYCSTRRAHGLRGRGDDAARRGARSGEAARLPELDEDRAERDELRADGPGEQPVERGPYALLHRLRQPAPRQ